ncbi:hypothetical protein ACFWYW_23915 [Nonomuraea sp. NPDC059023]|uniref:hypothetical protein n=1 Tax=unclassified Nonomuraea TaxID=2593643 RepID=UPI0036A2F93F
MTTEPKIRLLLCGTCTTIEELPDHHGPVESDDLLAYLASRHRFPSGTPHAGGQLFDVEEKHWRNTETRKQIVDQINARSGEGLGRSFYELKDTFKEDAFTCWKKHNRTTNCGDFKSEAKRLTPDTAAERKAAGLGKARSNRFLCEFCPHFSVVMQRMRAARGDYHYTG